MRPVGSTPETVTISPALNEIPLFVRGGSALPLCSPGLHVSVSSPVFLRCYGDGPWHGLLYEDDGVGFGYERGDFGLFQLSVSGSQVTAKHLDGHATSPKRDIAIARQR